MFAIFSRDREGSVAVSFAVCLFLVLGITGLAIDQSIGLSTRTSLQAALDSAVLAATKELSDGSGWDVAQAKGTATFNANIKDLPNAAVALENSGTPGDFKVSGTASAPWSRYFTHIIDSTNITINVSSVAAQQIKPVEVIFLADVSWSMGIGATNADISTMKASIGCAFACHYDGTDTKARNAGARLRIDVIADAYRLAIAEMQKAI